MSVITKAYMNAVNEIEEKIENACKKRDHKKVHIIFSLELDEYEMPIDNLNEIPLKGKVKFIYDNLESKVIKNPTWLDICVLTNEMIEKIDIYASNYTFDGIYDVYKDGNVFIASLNVR